MALAVMRGFHGSVPKVGKMSEQLTIELEPPVAQWLADIAEAVASGAGAEVTAATVAENILRGAFIESEGKEDF